MAARSGDRASSVDLDASGGAGLAKLRSPGSQEKLVRRREAARPPPPTASPLHAQGKPQSKAAKASPSVRMERKSSVVRERPPRGGTERLTAAGARQSRLTGEEDSEEAEARRVEVKRGRTARRSLTAPPAWQLQRALLGLRRMSLCDGGCISCACGGVGSCPPCSVLRSPHARSQLRLLPALQAVAELLHGVRAGRRRPQGAGGVHLHCARGAAADRVRS